MAGPLDWLSDALGSFTGGGGMPPQDPMGNPTGQPMPQAPDAPPPQPMPPPQVAQTPFPQGGDPMSGDGLNNGGLPPPMPMASPQDAPGMPAAPTDVSSGNRVPGPPMELGPGLGVGAPPPGSGAGPTAGWSPDQQGKGGLLAALGVAPDNANRMRGGLAAGLKAAGNSAGKSPFQALTSGAGEAMEGGQKEAQQNDKAAIGFLNAAISSKKAGDDAAYKTNYTKYLAAKLKADQEKVASSTASGNKMDSPTQLFLNAQRNVAGDPLVKAAMEGIKNSKLGTPQEQAAAQARYEQVVKERETAHLAGVGLKPIDAAKIGQEPGMTAKNPLDAGAAGITAKNIGQKLKPGQFYTNPSDGKVYQYKGSGGGESASSKPAPANPMKPARGSLPATSDDED